MTTHPIPRGWKRLKKRSVIKTGDKFHLIWLGNPWHITSCAGRKARKDEIYIRRNPKTKVEK